MRDVFASRAMRYEFGSGLDMTSIGRTLRDSGHTTCAYPGGTMSPRLRSKQALLKVALSADATVRVNAAAMLLYICGQATEPFDWDQRPFFLRFGEEDPDEVKAAWEELRRRTGL